jgi:hypothetical protein
MQDLADQTISALHGVHFDIPAPAFTSSGRKQLV